MIICPHCLMFIPNAESRENLGVLCSKCEEAPAAIEKVGGMFCHDCARSYEAEQMAALGRDSDGKPIATLQAVAG